MVNDTLCYAGYDENGGGNGILKSVDGGLTWEQDVTSATTYFPAYTSVFSKTDFLSGDIEVFSGAVPYNASGGLIFESAGISNWTSTSVDQPINDITAHPSSMFAVGDSGYIVMNSPLASSELNQQIDPFEFNVFPNPVENEVIIENLSGEAMKVTVLAGSGRIIKTETYSSLNSIIDCSHLKSGAYFIKVEIGEQCGIQRVVKL